MIWGGGASGAYRLICVVGYPLLSLVRCSIPHPNRRFPYDHSTTYSTTVLHHLRWRFSSSSSNVSLRHFDQRSSSGGYASHLLGFFLGVSSTNFHKKEPKSHLLSKLGSFTQLGPQSYWMGQDERLTIKKPQPVFFGCFSLWLRLPQVS